MSKLKAPEINTISRSPVVDIPADVKSELLAEPTAAELVKASQLDQEDMKVRDGLVKLGARPEEAELSVSFANFQSRHLASMVGLTSSGVAINFQRMGQVLRRLEGSIEKEFNDGGNIDNLDIQLRHYRDLSEECRRTAEMCQKSSFLLAKMEQMRQSQQTVKNKPRLGFKPKGDTNIIAQSVTVHPGK